MLYRRAKIIKRLVNGAQAVSVLTYRYTANFRCDQIVVRDVVSGSARKPIGLFDNTVVVFEKRHNILNSTSDVVKMMGTGDPTRCVVYGAIDEF